MSDAFEGTAFVVDPDGGIGTTAARVARERTVVEVAAAGLCGTDLREIRRRVSAPGLLPPLRPGHEVAGTVVSSDDGWRTGSRVLVDPAFVCGTCTHCGAGRSTFCEHMELLGEGSRPGGLASHVSVPGSALLPVPDGVDAVTAALVEPLACAHHAAGLVDGPGPVVVLGAGTIGLGVALVLRARGADVTVRDPAPARAALASALGFAGTPATRATPVVVEAAGSTDAFRDATDLVDRGGQVVVAAQHDGTLEIDAGRAFATELRLSWALGALRRDFDGVIALMAAGELDPRMLAAPVAPERFDTTVVREMAAGRTAKAVVTWDAWS